MAPRQLHVAVLAPLFLASLFQPGALAVRFFILGDSLLDTGNSVQNLGPGQTSNCAVQPYGVSLTGPGPTGPTGRCSNGKTLGDFISDALGLAATPPPVLQPGASFATGASLATNGASATVADQRTSNFTGERQVAYLKTAIWGSGAVGGAQADILVLLGIGSVDLSNFLRVTSPLLWSTQSRGYIARLVAAQMNYTQVIYNLGVRNIVVMNQGPAGCVPSVTSNTAGTCLGPINSIYANFNTALEKALVTLRPKLTGAKVLLLDTYAAAYGAARKTGLSISGQACCGTGSVRCAPNTALCPDPTKYFYWDNVHPAQNTVFNIHQLVWSGNTTFIRPNNISTIAKTIP